MLDECEWSASCPDSFYFWEQAILLSNMQDADWKTDENVADLSRCIIIILIYGFEFGEE
jgi:hypothetical protein